MVDRHVSISKGNSKMGCIPSVSLPPVTTCRPNAPCIGKCYAHKLAKLRPSVRNAYSNNMTLLNEDPTTYWREVEATIMLARYFRFHVSGDIPDETYLRRMVSVAARNTHCEILCFTKKYELVNQYLSEGYCIPQNLHIIFSGWIGLEMANPFSLPEAHVKYKNGFTTAKEDAIECGGNCTECALTDCGCWKLKSGQQILLNEH